ncbi:quinone oxidoreductase family protein [Paractinoplanes brasiliensis]|uniref:NADPH:quinone reductase-like Zn-dependent oxidoreductase n=1 Tax=Paractinoplanes brasiliensis TaxID=52695 RepID=A0A4R6JMJ9_9ACTN|nr:zinc-binding dehydrogenase [Actinoplanes brasiliensis]TDO37369.1 NADPH:quinone reductase-like Zn-dependent oxidoreductase [Actinoplanes brasiliensis]GID29314.1 trans-2-enoyl-CoA reductase [Actinoplanes brasiliensis]
MRALRVHDWGKDPVVHEIEEPVRGEGEVLVRVEAAALAHFDLTVASGNFALKPRLPYTGGVEGSGVVIEADDLAPGTQVMLRGGGLGLLRGGTWQERVSVARKAVTVLDPRLPPEVAATFFVPTTTAAVVLHDVAKLQPGEKVAVVGAAGAVGASVAQQALLAGAEVTGYVGRDDQLDLVPGGVTGVVLGEEPDEKADLLVDTLGGEGLIGRSRWVRQGGRAVVVGYVAGTRVTIDLPNWLLDDVALLPVNMIRHERRARELAPALIRKLAAGELSVAVESVSLGDAVDALRRMRSGHVRGRAVLSF